MDSMPRSKDRERSEREKLREMNLREKIEYIWSYYKFYIIGGLIVLGIIISILATCTSQPDVGLHIEWNASYIEQDDFDNLLLSVEERLFTEDSGKTVQGLLNFPAGDNLEFDMYYSARLMAMLSAGTIDVFILNRELLHNYANIGYLLPMEGILDEIRYEYPAIHEKIMDAAVYADCATGGDLNEHLITGVKITESALFSNLTYNLSDDVYFCVAASTNNPGNVRLALAEFFKQEG